MNMFLKSCCVGLLSPKAFLSVSLRRRDQREVVLAKLQTFPERNHRFWPLKKSTKPLWFPLIFGLKNKILFSYSLKGTQPF